MSALGECFYSMEAERRTIVREVEKNLKGKSRSAEKSSYRRQKLKVAKSTEI